MCAHASILCLLKPVDAFLGGIRKQQGPLLPFWKTQGSLGPVNAFWDAKGLIQGRVDVFLEPLAIPRVPDCAFLGYIGIPIAPVNALLESPGIPRAAINALLESLGISRAPLIPFSL